MRFTTAYSACTVCSPSRAALMTGQAPARLRVTDWIPGEGRVAKLREPVWTKSLPPAPPTVAERLKQLGYATAIVGKWHLGSGDAAPEKRGFDLNRGAGHHGQPPSYFSPYKLNNLRDGPPGEYLTDREADESLRFIEANRDRPFFLYLAHYAPHTPLQAPEPLIKKYQEAVRPGLRHKDPTYAAMIEKIDDTAGRIVAKLEELKLTGNTLVIFTSDNGGHPRSTSNAPLRAAKGHVYEGGVRVPLIAVWPGRIPAGATNDTPVIGTDLAPTLLAAASVNISSSSDKFDGENLLPLLTGGPAPARDALFWHYPHYHNGGATPYGAIRAGDWRLIEFYEDNRVELYNLTADPSEKRDLAAAEPERAEALRARLAAWRTEVGAQMPTPR